MKGDVGYREGLNTGISRERNRWVSCVKGIRKQLIKKSIGWTVCTEILRSMAKR
jgi:hypothetical protein